MQYITALFSTIINMSASASIVIIIVLAIRMLFRKAPKVFSYILWGFVLIRLLIPITFESKVSVLTIPSAISNEIIQENPVFIETVKQVTTIPVQIMQGYSMVEILSLVWLTVIVCLLIYFIVNYFRTRKSIKYAIKVVDNVYETDTIAIPFIFGVIHPRIYIPTSLNDRQKQIVLAHEIVHIQRKDYLIKYFALFVLLIYWFNPLVWISFYCMSRDMELSCDEKVVNRLGVGCKHTFGLTILEFAMSPYILFVSFSNSNTKVRIKNILDYKKPKFWMLLGCVITGLLLIVPLLTNPTKPTKKPTPVSVVEPTSETSTNSPIESNNNSDEINFNSPLENYEITCNWGCYEGHQGVDMKDIDNPNANILATEKGTVEEVGFDTVNGNYILLNHNNGYQSGYAHLKELPTLNVGDEINQGEILGVTGKTGMASGEHLHFFISKDGVRLSNTLELIQ